MVFAALALLVAAPACADDSGVFTVHNVKVDVTADTAAHARDEAIAEGQEAAFKRLIARLTLAVDRSRLPAFGPDAVSEYVRDFEVADEKTSSVRYLATLTIRFKPDAVRAMLRQYGVGFAETRSKPLLVLPVYEVAGAVSLWDTPNPWRDAWGKVPPIDGLVPLVLPKGDLQDVATIGAEQAVSGDDKRLAAIAKRYGAADVLVARADLRSSGAPSNGGGSSPWLQVTLSRFGTIPPDQTRVEAFYPKGSEDQAALFVRAASAVANEIEENWKRNNRLRFDTGNELTVEVPLRSLAEWIKIKHRLGNVAFIRRNDLIYLTRKLATLRLNFIGDEEQLRVALAQSDLTLEHGATSWVMHLGNGGMSSDDKSGAP